MARGHQKIQSQQKNKEKLDKQKKSQGHDQKKAAQAALVFTCAVCKAQMPDPRTYKQHFENKHPKSPVPAELAEFTGANQFHLYYVSSWYTANQYISSWYTVGSNASLIGLCMQLTQIHLCQALTRTSERLSPANRVVGMPEAMSTQSTDPQTSPGAASGGGDTTVSVSLARSLIPQQRVKTIIRQQCDTENISAGAVFAVSKAAEMFVRNMTLLLEERKSDDMPLTEHESADCNIEYNDIAYLVREEPSLRFLRDYVPVQIKALEALELYERNKTTTLSESPDKNSKIARENTFADIS